MNNIADRVTELYYVHGAKVAEMAGSIAYTAASKPLDDPRLAGAATAGTLVGTVTGGITGVVLPAYFGAKLGLHFANKADFGGLGKLVLGVAGAGLIGSLSWWLLVPLSMAGGAIVGGAAGVGAYYAADALGLIGKPQPASSNA